MATVLLAAGLLASDVGKRFPSEKFTYTDRATGLPITVLTNAPSNDSKIYPTHPQWAADGRHIIFRSNRSANNGTQIFAVNEVTGAITQITDTPGTNAGTINIAEKSMKIYFLRNLPMSGAPVPAPPPSPGAITTISQMIELDLAALLADSEAGTMKAPATYERLVATLPQGMRESGGFGLDADEQFAYIGVRGGDTGQHLPPGTELVQTAEGQRMGAGPAGIRSINLQTGEIKVVIDTPFLMGHVQANPWVPGEIVYCHETGGDAPQRMWTVRADGSGNRPLYPESPDEWVTHEAIITPDEVVFNILGHQPRLRNKPTGIAVINLRDGQMKLYNNVEEQMGAGRGGAAQAGPPRRGGGFWHSNGSPDGRWLAGDSFGGSLYLIDRSTGETILLSTDHRMQPDHLHPTFSRDSKRILVQSGHLSNGENLDLMVMTIPQELQNRR